MHVALVGGIGTGKTEIANRLCELVDDTEYVYMSKFAVRVPMALQYTSHPDLLKYTRQEYVHTVLSNLDIPELKFERAEMDTFGNAVFRRYGSTVTGEIALAAVPEGKTGVFDGVATVENVRYMKKNGVYIVGLKCLFETQVERMLKRKKAIDPKDEASIERQIHDTQKFFETEKCMRLAHITYNTNKMNAIEIACAVGPLILATR